MPPALFVLNILLQLAFSLKHIPLPWQICICSDHCYSWKYCFLCSPYRELFERCLLSLFPHEILISSWGAAIPRGLLFWLASFVRVLFSFSRVPSHHFVRFSKGFRLGFHSVSCHGYSPKDSWPPPNNSRSSSRFVCILYCLFIDRARFSGCL